MPLVRTHEHDGRLFDELWSTLCSERKALLQCAHREQQLLRNLEETRELLRHSPYRHIQRAVGLSRALWTPLDQKGFLVYYIFSTKYGKGYVGMVGLQGPRALIARFPEHLNTCNYEAKRHSPTCFGMQPNHGGCLLCCYTGYLGIFSSFLV